ncbi:hypothetical protein A3860_30215 [Niastella vici]|uniref:Uncharacterized protein n=1 Tax=Niastella vici TaxID=1703345 RepID=A0A1V9FUC0_9BACT|nr:hypothetical protein [Niastella vici]OQP61969.1 hypothetical protein A3860_30215 [Niastella vici]
MNSNTLNYYTPIGALYKNGHCTFTVWAPLCDSVSVIVPADLFLLLPPNAPGQWKNEFTGETIMGDNSLPLHLICNVFPVALLTGYNK